MGSTRFEQRLSDKALVKSSKSDDEAMLTTISSSDEINMISDDESDVVVTSTSYSSTRAAHDAALRDDPNMTTTAASICDACQYCHDVCDVPNCVKCQSKKSHHVRQHRQYTMCQIRRHNSIESSVWIIADDTVYDVTSYIQYHPGGMECILKKAGGKYNCSRDLRFHSHRGQQLFSKCAIGKVISCTGCLSSATALTASNSATTTSSRPSMIAALEQHRWFLW